MLNLWHMIIPIIALCLWQSIGTWRGNLRIGETAVTAIFPFQREIAPARKPGVNGMIYQIPRQLSILTKHPRTTASDISGYSKLETANGSSGTIYACNVSAPFAGIRDCTAEEFATDAGDLDGILATSTNQTADFKAWYQRIAGAPAADIAQIILDFYHRTSGGTETLIETITRSITTSETQHANSFNLANQLFGTNERLVIKARFHWELGGGP